MYTEMSIGLAKHCLKTFQAETTADAYSTFTKLSQYQFINSNLLTTWRKIIGLRNGLVHDYLNIDLQIIEHIIREQHYLDLKQFCDLAISHLKSK